MLPLLAVLAAPVSARIAVTFLAALLGLFATGWGSAKLGRAPTRLAVLRLVIGGAVAMVFTFAIGYLFGAAAG